MDPWPRAGCGDLFLLPLQPRSLLGEKRSKGGIQVKWVVIARLRQSLMEGQQGEREGKGEREREGEWPVGTSPGSSRPGKSSLPYSDGRKSIPRDPSYFGSIFIPLLLTMTLEKGKSTHSSIPAWKIPWGRKELDTTK